MEITKELVKTILDNYHLDGIGNDDLHQRLADILVITKEEAKDLCYRIIYNAHEIC